MAAEVTRIRRTEDFRFPCVHSGRRKEFGMTNLARRVGLGLLGVVLAGCGLINIKAKDSDAGTEAGPDQGMLGALHQANQGKFVFAKNTIPRDAAANFGLADSFRLDEQIFARAFYAKSPRNSLAGMPDPDKNCKWDNRRELQLAISSDKGSALQLENDVAGPKTWATYTTLLLTEDTGGLLPLDKQVILPQDRNEISARLAIFLATLSDGEHTLELVQNAHCNSKPKTSMATGEFRVTVDAAGRSRLAKQIRLAETGMKTQPGELKRLADAAAATFNQAKVLHFRPIQDGWNVRLGPNENPIDRTVIAMALLEEGGKCTLRTSEIVEQHEGGGKYGAPRFLEVTDGALGQLTDLAVPCDIDVEKQ